MNISVTIFVVLISTCIVNASVLDPVIENVVHLQASKPPSHVPGIWKKKTIWKPRWVKEWKSAKVMKPVWKKVWSPVQIKEWLPIPKPPPGWSSMSTPLVPVKTTTKTTIPLLWDPIPYPESQQPPPPSHDANYPPCDSEGCGEPLAFNHQQISGIIGLNRHKDSSDYSQNPEYSETVTHLTRVPPNGNWGRQPQQTGNFQFDNRFSFPELSQFLVPPRFHPLTDNNLHFHFRNQQPKPQPTRPSSNVHVSHSPGFEVKPNKTPPWIPLPPRNNIKGHFITKAPDQPYKFESPNKNNTGKEAVEPTAKPGFKNQNVDPRPPVDGDFIQEAELVGEYHYSEFDLTKDFKPELTKPELTEEEERGNAPHVHHQQGGNTPQVPQQKGNAPHVPQQRGNAPHVPQQGGNAPQVPQQKGNAPHVPQQKGNAPHVPQQRGNAPHVPQQGGNTPQVPQQRGNAPQVPQQIGNAPQVPQQRGKNPQVPQLIGNAPQVPQQKGNALQVPQQREKIPQQILPKGGQKPLDGNRIPLPIVESKPRQIRKDGRPPQQLPHFNSSIQQQEAIIKEIFPFYTPMEVATSTPFPSNHRFAPLKDLLEKPNFNFNRTILQLPDIIFHPEFVTPNPRQLSKTQKSEFEHEINHITEQTQKATTTETTTPYTIFPNSSFLSTTEAETEGPVYVVTPAYSIKS